MPAELEHIREVLRREHPGMAKSRTFAIATSAFKKSHGIHGKTTEGEMARAAHEKTAGPILRWTLERAKRAIKKNEKEEPTMDKISSFEHGFFGELGKIAEETYMPFATRHPAVGALAPWGTLQAKGQIAAKGRKALEESPWSVRHPVLHPILTSLGGGVGGAAAGAGIAAALGKDTAAGASIGGSLGSLGGAVGGRVYGGVKGKNRIQELNR